MTATAIKDSALSREQIEGDVIYTLYVRLTILRDLSGILWQENPKQHDIELIYQSIKVHGFIDPPKWDQNLNEGRGGLVYGNGRTEAIVGALVQAFEAGEAPPVGIAVAKDNGEWCVPINFGVDATSEVAAMAAAIDHNNVNLAGAGLSEDQKSRIWVPDSYLSIIERMQAETTMPVSMPDSEVAGLITTLQARSELLDATTKLDEFIDAGEAAEPKTKAPRREVNEAALPFNLLMSKDDRQLVYDAIELAKKFHEIEDSALALVEICRQFYGAKSEE